MAKIIVTLESYDGFHHARVAVNAAGEEIAKSLALSHYNTLERLRSLPWERIDPDLDLSGPVTVFEVEDVGDAETWDEAVEAMKESAQE